MLVCSINPCSPFLGKAILLKSLTAVAYIRNMSTSVDVSWKNFHTFHKLINISWNVVVNVFEDIVYFQSYFFGVTIFIWKWQNFLEKQQWIFRQKAFFKDALKTSNTLTTLSIFQNFNRQRFFSAFFALTSTGIQIACLRCSPETQHPLTWHGALVELQLCGLFFPHCRTSKQCHATRVTNKKRQSLISFWMLEMRYPRVPDKGIKEANL